MGGNSDACISILSYDQLTNAYDVFAEGHLIRRKRQAKTIQFLNEIYCKNFADELEKVDSLKVAFIANG